MLGFLNHKKFKYLILIPVVYLLFNSLYYKHTMANIENAMLQQKYVEITDMVNMLGAAVEASPERDWQEHERNIVDSVEYIDKLYQIYAGIYKPIDMEMVLITERFCETEPKTESFNPFDYPQFQRAILLRDSGKVIVNYASPDQPRYDVHLYFRWMPTSVMHDERYLVVAGVSKHSIITKIPESISIGLWVGTVIIFLLNVWLVVMVSQLGYISEQRGGKKWRKPCIRDNQPCAIRDENND